MISAVRGEQLKDFLVIAVHIDNLIGHITRQMKILKTQSQLSTKQQKSHGPPKIPGVESWKRGAKLLVTSSGYNSWVS